MIAINELHEKDKNPFWKKLSRITNQNKHAPQRDT